MGWWSREAIVILKGRESRELMSGASWRPFLTARVPCWKGTSVGAICGQSRVGLTGSQKSSCISITRRAEFGGSEGMMS